MAWFLALVSGLWSKIGGLVSILDFIKWVLRRGDQKDAQEKKEKQRKEYRNADETAEKTGDTSQLERMFDSSKPGPKRSSVRKSKARTKRAKPKPSSD